MNTVSLIKLNMALLDRVVTSPESAVLPYTIPTETLLPKGRRFLTWLPDPSGGVAIPSSRLSA
jgi:hypothetical protein